MMCLDKDVRAEIERCLVERLKDSPEYAELRGELEGEDRRLMYGDGSKPKPQGVLRFGTKK